MCPPCYHSYQDGGIRSNHPATPRRPHNPSEPNLTLMSSELRLYLNRTSPTAPTAPPTRVRGRKSQTNPTSALLSAKISKSNTRIPAILPRMRPFCCPKWCFSGRVNSRLALPHPPSGTPCYTKRTQNVLSLQQNPSTAAAQPRLSPLTAFAPNRSV